MYPKSIIAPAHIHMMQADVAFFKSFLGSVFMGISRKALHDPAHLHMRDADN